MNGSCQTPDAILCGCCEGIGPETPQVITNRPALSTVAYRTGTWATFKASMLAALSDPDNGALAGLRTRDDSDFSIALIDAWAVVADILSFYQERVANESWLRTAVDQRSVFELARLVGYRPSPGVSASAFLAFTLSNAPGAPDNVTIPAGTRVQSVPGPGQTPQTFETSQDFVARISLNAIPAQTTRPWSLSAGDTSTTLQGTALNLKPGDGLLFASGELRSSLTTGAADFHYVASAIADANNGVTTVSWDQPLTGAIGQNNSDVYVYVFRKRAALFGVQAPDPRTFPSSSPISSSSDWTYDYTPGSMQVNLDASYAGLAPAAGGEPAWVIFTAPPGMVLFNIARVAETGPTKYTLTTKTTQLTLGGGEVLVNDLFRIGVVGFTTARQSFALASASGFNVSNVFTEASDALDVLRGFQPVTADQMLGAIVARTRSATVFVQSELLPQAGPPYLGPWSFDGVFARQAELRKPVEGSSLEVVGGQDVKIGQPVAISGKRLRLQVTTGSAAAFVPLGATGAVAVSDSQVFLVETFPPESEGDNQVWQVTSLSAVTGSLTTPSSNILLQQADSKDMLAAESAVIAGTTVAGAITTLAFDQPLLRIYDRATVTVNANAVTATHGETVHEIVGSGDATNPALQFTLKQTPLTYVSSSSALGSQSTLQVWVNNLQWHEAGNFLASQPADRVFVTRADPKGNAIVQFGDGTEGARVPTGQMNIRAKYRKGIGSAGMVAGGQLSQALDRPAGVSTVTNPSAATGGADPDSAEDARTSAPLHVLTLGRVVSLEDYQNFARAFAGIEKALATWTWFGKRRGVFLTVAGANGAQFNAGDPTVVHLTQALIASGNPYVPTQVVSFTPVLFEIGADVIVDGVNYDPTEVLRRVWQSLAQAFAFEARNLGQGVAQSEVVTLIQQTAGVVAVELTSFNRSGDFAQSPLPAVLRAASPLSGGNTIPRAAEMLLLDPASRGNIGART